MQVKIGEKQAEINLDYNYEAYREMKKIPDSVYLSDNHSWLLNNVYIKDLLKCLQELNLDVLEAMKIVNNNIDSHKSYSSETIIEQVKTVRVFVEKENKKTIALGFDYDPDVLSMIKSLEFRKYNPKSKSWNVNKVDIDWLYDKLEEMGYVDVSELDKFKSNQNENVKISLSDFPKMNRKPFDFQVDVSEMLIKQKKIINALEAGLGKTFITVMACEKLQEKTLIVCPASVKENWKKEIHIVNPDADVNVLDSKDEYRSAQYVILNYDILGKFIDDILSDDFNIGVFDEAHKIRGVNGRGMPSSKRAKLSMKIAESMEYVYPVTATPFINYTRDIFNLLKIVDHSMTNSWYAFANTYCDPDRSDFGVSFNGSSNQEQLNERLYPNGMIRLLSDDYIDLPERMRSFVPVKINLQKYNKQVQDYLDKRTSLETNGEHLVYLSAMRMTLAKEKAKHSVEMIKDLLEQNESIVVFTNYTKVVDSLMKKFEDDAVKVTGDVNGKERQKNVDLFQSGEKRVFIGNIDAAGEGITLTKASNMIVIDMHWSPVAMVKQMEKRIHRISQTKPAKITYLYGIGASIDEMMVEMLEKKLNDASLILDGEKESFAEDLINKM